MKKDQPNIHRSQPRGLLMHPSVQRTSGVLEVGFEALRWEIPWQV
jgi:hypothetical protein